MAMNRARLPESSEAAALGPNSDQNNNHKPLRYQARKNILCDVNEFFGTACQTLQFILCHPYYYISKGVGVTPIRTSKKSPPYKSLSVTM